MLKGLSERLSGMIQDHGFQKYLKNTMWMFSDQLLRLVAGLFVGIWVARYLGPDDFGVFNYAIAFAAIIGVIAKLGLDSLLVRGLVDHPELTDQYLGTGFWLKVTGSIFTFILTVSYLLTANEDDYVKVYILILTTSLIFQAFEVADFYFQAKVLSKFASISKTVQLSISSLLKLYLIFIKADLFWFIVVQFIDQVTLGLTQLVIFKVYSKKAPFLRHFNKAIAADLLKDSWPLVFGSLAIMVYMRVDQIMIMKMLGEKEMGLFSAAVRLSEAWYFVPLIITNSLFPAILNAKKINEEEYYKRLQKLFKFMVLISTVVALPVTFLAPWLMTMLFGEPFREGAAVLSIHIWTGLFVSLGLATTGWFIAENMQRFSLLKTVSGVFLNIALNFLLIPKYGIVGAAISTIICQAGVSVLFNVALPKTLVVFKMQIKAFVR